MMWWYNFLGSGPRKDKIIQSFSGVGSLTSQVLLAEVPELGFLSRKEITALVA
jgi:transposase